MFSTLNVNIGYWQNESYDSDRDKKAFTPCHNFYCLVRMPIGPRIGPETFQSTRDVICPALNSNSVSITSTV